MSSQRGNVQKKGPPKHQNKSKFKNDLHDRTKKIQIINSLSVTGCCSRCKEIIEWKIKYKKYKPLSQAKKCVRCSGRTVRRAYYIACDDCAEKHQICAKCGQAKDIVLKAGLSEAEELSQQNKLEQELKFLSERQRRTFFRAQASGKLQEAVEQAAGAGAESFDDSEDEEAEEEADEDCDEETNCDKSNADDFCVEAESQFPADSAEELIGEASGLAAEKETIPEYDTTETDCERKVAHEKENIVKQTTDSFKELSASDKCEEEIDKQK